MEISDFDSKVSVENANKNIVIALGEKIQKSPVLSGLSTAARIDGFFLFAVRWSVEPEPDQAVLCVSAVSHYIKSRMGHVHVENFFIKSESNYYKRLISVAPVCIGEVENFKDAYVGKLSDPEFLASLKTLPRGQITNRPALPFLRARYISIFDKFCRFRSEVREGRGTLFGKKLFFRKKYTADYSSAVVFLLSSFLFMSYEMIFGEHNEHGSVVILKTGSAVYYLLNTIFFSSILYAAVSYFYHRKILNSLTRAKCYLIHGTTLSECMNGIFREIPKFIDASGLDGPIQILDEIEKLEKRRMTTVFVICTLFLIVSQKLVNALPNGMDRVLSFSEYVKILGDALQSTF